MGDWIKELEQGKVEKPKPVEQVPEKKMEFDLSPDSGSPKEVFTIWGNKGEGKTSVALSFPGTICAISFDRKTIQTRNNMFKERKDIHVFDGIRYYKSKSTEVLDSAEKSIEYLHQLLEGPIKEKQPNWILFDGLEVFVRMAEFLMRKRNTLKPYQGISNMNVWKERNSFLDTLHNLALSIAKRGVIYTTYTKLNEKIIRDGTVMEGDEQPKWLGDVMLQTDFTIKSYSTYDEDKGKKFYLHINNSKNDSKLKTGETYEMTGKKLLPMFEDQPKNKEETK